MPVHSGFSAMRISGVDPKVRSRQLICINRHEYFEHEGRSGDRIASRNRIQCVVSRQSNQCPFSAYFNAFSSGFRIASQIYTFGIHIFKLHFLCSCTGFKEIYPSFQIHHNNNLRVPDQLQTRLLVFRTMISAAVSLFTPQGFRTTCHPCGRLLQRARLQVRSCRQKNGLLSGQLVQHAGRQAGMSHLRLDHPGKRCFSVTPSVTCNTLRARICFCTPDCQGPCSQIRLGDWTDHPCGQSLQHPRGSGWQSFRGSRCSTLCAFVQEDIHEADDSVLDEKGCKPMFQV